MGVGPPKWCSRDLGTSPGKFQPSMLESQCKGLRMCVCLAMLTEQCLPSNAPEPPGLTSSLGLWSVPGLHPRCLGNHRGVSCVEGMHLNPCPISPAIIFLLSFCQIRESKDACTKQYRKLEAKIVYNQWGSLGLFHVVLISQTSILVKGPMDVTLLCISTANWGVTGEPDMASLGWVVHARHTTWPLYYLLAWFPFLQMQTDMQWTPTYI